MWNGGEVRIMTVKKTTYYMLLIQMQKDYLRRWRGTVETGRQREMEERGKIVGKQI